MNRRVLLFALLAAARLARPSAAPACSPSFPEVVFTPRVVSVIPDERFLGGELGIIQPGYGLRQLWPTYRLLLGRGLTTAEQRTLLQVEGPTPQDPKRQPAPVEEWLRERATVAGAGEPPAQLNDSRSWPGIDRRGQKPGEWFSYLNCPEDAFRTASRTLRDRVGRFGAGSAEVLSWVQAQDAVFSNCAEGRVIPEPAHAGADPVIRADRAYQIAAAHFYAEDYEAAERLFREIASDPASPWRDIAGYLVGRTLLRRATVPGRFRSPPDSELLAKAAQVFSSLLGDPSRAAVHGPAASHARLVQAVLDPDAYLGGIAAALSAPSDDPQVGVQFREYDFLLRGHEWRRGDGAAIGDMTSWVLAVLSLNRPTATGREARERPSTFPWLLAALMGANPAAPQTPALLEAAAGIPEDSPAYPTGAYHRLRLLIGGGKIAEGRRLADRLLESQRWSATDRNLILAERMKTARTLEEFLRDAQRRPVGVDHDGHMNLLPLLPAWFGERFEALFDGRLLLDRDGVSTMEQWFPLTLLQSAAASPALPAHIRRDLALAVFVRASLLGDHGTCRAIAPTLQKLAPEIGEGLQRYLKAKGDQESSFAAAFLILNAPGMQASLPWGRGRRFGLMMIDSYHDNWWGDLEPQRVAAGGPPAFLSPEQLAALSREREKLREIPAAPEHLGGIVLAWARAHPKDARVPETLHLVVRAGHFGMARSKLPTSRAAFELLHRRYPDSEWAGNTPYWY